MSTWTTRERGEPFGPRFELFADVLVVGAATALACLPLVTVPAALSTACAWLRRRRLGGQPCTTAGFFALLRRRALRGGDLAAGLVLLVCAGVLAADAGLAAYGLPGAAPFTVLLAAVATVGAVVALRSCAQEGDDGQRGAHGAAEVPAGRAQSVPPVPPVPPVPLAGEAGYRWRAAVRAAAARTAGDLPGSVLVLLALCTAAVCVLTQPLLLFLVPGPLAVGLTAVELRYEEARR